ncbi:DUF6510 family protein [Agromyces aerolatus]|uniref:DUF6510 family protein n=1 Tax=Agromyces sp. LY-1074 TaxID=3074080 RepID=UPI002865AAE3|nr:MULTISPECIES: DUF6510 family protein [unclassified Agromyces]MDR5699289.1 DUF6510 family protein [Agromyces sp. LY-1074]MDR5705585.1 DUF6510 family protein [Agromyces sp. LY-1358]
MIGRPGMQHLDGNVLAGDLAAVFGGDVTAMLGSCAFCRARGAVAELMVYRTAMGSVGRCATCGEVLVVVVERGDRPMVSLAGLRALELAAP